MITKTALTPEEIMERLERLSFLGTSIKCRTAFPHGPSKWYVHMGGVNTHLGCAEMSGTTPQEAITNTWKNIAESGNHPKFIRYFCKPDEPVPGNGPQVWVKWNNEIDDWEDVEPDDHWAHKASEITPYKIHKMKEKLR